MPKTKDGCWILDDSELVKDKSGEMKKMLKEAREEVAKENKRTAKPQKGEDSENKDK